MQDAYGLEVMRFGLPEQLVVPGNSVLTFPHGVVGMDDLRRFALLEDERIAPCRWLQSLDEPQMVFVAVDPHLVEPHYQASISEEDAAALELARPQDASLWVLVTVQPDPSESTVNLLAPVIVNPQRRLGAQVILHDSDYSIRQPIGSPPSPRSLEAPEPTAHAGAHPED